MTDARPKVSYPCQTPNSKLDIPPTPADSSLSHPPMPLAAMVSVVQPTATLRAWPTARPSRCSRLVVRAQTAIKIPAEFKQVTRITPWP